MGAITGGIDPITKQTVARNYMREVVDRFTDRYIAWLTEMMIKYGERDIAVEAEDQKMVDHAMKCQHIWFDDDNDKIHITKYGKDFLSKI